MKIRILWIYISLKDTPLILIWILYQNECMYIGSAFDFTLLKWLFLRLICPFHFKQLVTLLRSSSVRLDFLTYIFLWHSNEFVMTLLFFSRAPKNQIEFASAYQFVWRCKRDFYLTLKLELFRISFLQVVFYNTTT